MLRLVQQVLLIFFLILLLAALPMIIEVNPVDKNIDWNFEKLPEIYGHFISEISRGSLGTYQLGTQERLIAKDIGDNFLTSLKVMIIGVNFAVIMSLFFGIFVSRFRMTKIFRACMNIFAVIPDFILIILSMILAVEFYQSTGIRVISMRSDAGALNLWFPIVLVGIAPTLYLFKLIAVKYYQTSGEDYIKTAVAKGIGINDINFQHVYKNIEPFVKAELVKMISLAVGNLFIIEYILNVSGITKFIFQSNEIQSIAIGLFSMLVISLIAYFSVRIGLYVFKRGFIHE